MDCRVGRLNLISLLAKDFSNLPAKSISRSSMKYPR
jgi:hypothetical protein